MGISPIKRPAGAGGASSTGMRRLPKSDRRRNLNGNGNNPDQVRKGDISKRDGAVKDSQVDFLF